MTHVSRGHPDHPVSIHGLSVCIPPLVLLAALGLASGYVDPTLTPPMVEDGLGNVADEEDKLTWSRQYPEGEAYQSPDEVSTDDINSKYYASVDKFTGLVLPDDPPYDLIKGLLNSEVDISDETMTLVRLGAGVATCFTVGILFVIVMPCVGCLFCCCRCCGKCGGRLSGRKQKGSAWCCAHTIMLLAVCSITGSGCILFIRSSMEMEKGIQTTLQSSQLNLVDIRTYINNMVQEIQFLVENGYNFTAEVIKRDFDNIDFLVGLSIRNQLDSAMNITNNLNTIIDLDNDISSILELELSISSSTYDIQEKGDQLSADLDSIRSRFEDILAMAGCNDTCQDLVSATSDNITMRVNFTELPDLTTNITVMTTVKNASLSDSVRKDSKDFYEIPERVKNETNDQVDAIKDSIDGFSTDIHNSLSSLADLPSSVDPFISDYTTMIGNVENSLVGYLKYISYSSYGLVAPFAVIILLQFLGALGAICFYKEEVEPPKRSKTSHNFGNLLLAATGISFIFSWILMLLVSIQFLVGITLDRVLCDQLAGPDYLLLKNWIDTPDSPLGDGYILGELILQDSSVRLTISGTLSACERNEPAYTALRLSNIVDLNETTNYQDMDIDGDFEDMSVEFSDITLLSDGTATILDLYKSGLQIDYPTYESILTTDIVMIDLIELVEAIRRVANDNTTQDPAKTEMLDVADILENIQAESVTVIRSNQSDMLEDINKLENITKGKASTIDGVKIALKDAETFVHSNASQVFTSTLQLFRDRIFGVLDSFVDRVTTGMTEEVGGCRPLYNIWTSILEGEFCAHLVQPFNGMWFSLGGLVFFLVPSIIFSVKLSKYIRIMKYKRNVVHPEMI